MPDRRDGGQRAGSNGAGQRLIVEGPQILHGSTAAGDDDDVHVRHVAKRQQRGGDGGGGALALHGRGCDHDGHRKAAVGNANDVAEDGSLSRSHHANPAGQKGQRPLACAIEQPLGEEFLLERLEGQGQGARARGFDARDLKLKPAAAFVDGQLASAAHELAVAQAKLEAAGVARVHHAVELRLGVLEREIEVSVGRTLEARDLALDAHIAEAGLQGLACFAHQLGHGQDADLFGRGRWRCDGLRRWRGRGRWRGNGKALLEGELGHVLGTIALAGPRIARGSRLGRPTSAGLHHAPRVAARS